MTGAMDIATTARRRTAWLGLLAAAALAACAGPRPPVVAAAAPPPPPAPAVADQPPAPTPINAGLSPAATLWHLRAGLNVAALGCRGIAAETIVARYNALLAAQAPALAAAQAAYEAEYRAAGGDWRDRFDGDQTRLYNFFGQVRGHEALCAAAEETLAAMAGVDAAALPAFAAERLAALDRTLAPPVLTVDARVFDAPARVALASR